MKIHVLIVLLFALCAAMGCRSSKKGNTQTHIVEIKQMKFVPEHLKVSPGDSVRWINKDFFTHNVAEEEAGLWKSSELQKGERFAIQIDREVSYTCTLHPVMKGSITLKNN